MLNRSNSSNSSSSSSSNGGISQPCTAARAQRVAQQKCTSSKGYVRAAVVVRAENSAVLFSTDTESNRGERYRKHSKHKQQHVTHSAALQASVYEQQREGYGTEHTVV
jgi:hypothetical protein